MTKNYLKESTVDHKKSGSEEIIRILHVDDQTDILKVSKQILETQGPFQVDMAASVEEANVKMKEKEFEVIVSDYQMPIKDGLQFLKELRDNGNNIPFILFTGKGREEVAIKALNLGADLYRNKIGTPETVYGQLSKGILQTVSGNKAEEQLIFWREFNTKVVNAFGEPLLIINPKDFTIVTANDAILKQLGLSIEDIVGKTCYETTHHISTPSQPPEHNCPIQEMLKTGKVYISRTCPF